MADTNGASTPASNPGASATTQPLPGMPQTQPLTTLDQAPRARGKLKVFLGAAPGVGKTTAMLQGGHQRLSEGVDAVVGIVETHGRAETGGLVQGLEVVPRRTLMLRGRPFEEMDVDAIIARAPKLVLVDELAHTNIAGSRHPKRHQDVEELLDAGIDVYTTLNIQHLESLNDVIAQVSRIRVRETLPDSVLQRADDVVLIDLAPEELLQRLQQGKIYVPEQARRAMSHFFSPGNLTALRELALRQAAERVDAQMLTYMQAHAIAGPWPTRERILVCVGDDPISARMVRIAKRTAERRRAPWIAAYVETARHAGLAQEVKDRIAAAMRLAEQLGGEAVTLAGDNPVDDVLRFAEQRNVTQVIVGKSRRPRWMSVFSPSFTERLLAASDRLDVLVITADEQERQSLDTSAVAPLPSARAKVRFPWRMYGIATLSVLVAAGITWSASRILPFNNHALVFLTAIILVAIRGGRWPAVYAAFLSLAVYHLVFRGLPTSFRFGSSTELLTLIVFLVAGIITANLAEKVRTQVQQTKLSVRRTTNLYDFNRKVAGAVSLDDVLWAVVHHVAATVMGRALVLMPDGERHGLLSIVAGYPPETQLDESSQAAADWSWKHGNRAGRGSSTLPEAEWLFLPLKTARGPVGVLGVQIEATASGPGRVPSPEEERLLDTLADQAAVSIERTNLVSDFEEARILMETEKLRSALLSSISHDLRTPLVSVVGSVTSLIDFGEKLTPATRMELLETIREESERLNRFVQNLLDMTRLGSGALKPQREWIEIGDVVGAALDRLKTAVGGRPVAIEIEPGLPLVHADFVLIEQVLINIVDNAAKYSPPDGPIRITAKRRGEMLEVSVADAGPGIPAAERDRIFDMFYRVKATDSQAAGTGLGLAICRGIVEAHGGTIEAVEPPEEEGQTNDHPARGACIRFTLPLTEPPAMAELELEPALPFKAAQPAGAVEAKAHA